MTDLRIIARCVLMLAGAAASTVTMAQVTAPSAAASAAAEKAQKETDRTMYWIRVLAQTPQPAAPKAAPSKPVAAAPAPQPKVAAASERVRVASATPAAAPAFAAAAAHAPNPVGVGIAAPEPVVVAAPAAEAPSLAAATGTADTHAMTSGGVDAGLSSAGLAGSLAAPAAVAPQIDVPVGPQKPDPGLVMIKSADPEFPDTAMRRLRKGKVEVRFEVDNDGVVDVVSVVQTSNAVLNDAALDAVRQWRFKPTPKRHTGVVALTFDLDS
jgi:protein TonB